MSAQPVASSDATANDDSSGPLRKRRRTDDTGSSKSDVILVQVEPEEAESEAAPVVRRDEEFYRDKEGAECVIRVEDTLFKVHRFLLTRDSTVFQNMFALPSSENTNVVEEGSNDDNPIVLQDKLESFRALLWVLYALPTMLLQYNAVDTPFHRNAFDRLLTIAEIANKYQFISLEFWAVRAIYSSAKLPSSSWRTAYSSDLASRILEVAKLCSHPLLDTLVTEVWIARLLTGNRDWCPHSALAIGEKYKSHKLQGAAYYMLLVGMTRTRAPQIGGPQFLSRGAHLTKDLHLRLLLGYWSLTKLWERLRVNLPHHVCKPKCIATLRDVWSQVCDLPQVRSSGPEDVLGKLGIILREGKDDPHLYFQALQPICRGAVSKALRSQMLEIQDGLIDHFSEVV